MANRSLAQQTAAFSTSAALYANPLKKKAGAGVAPKKAVKTLNVKKNRKSAAESSKPPAPGERKALRKRIVLSNNNALEVSSLADVTDTDVLSEMHAGKVVGIPEEAVDALRAVEAFKVSQGWGLFRRPAVLYRRETVELAGFVQQVEHAKIEGKGKTVRRVVTGGRMVGKSTVVLQGLLMGVLRGWWVVNFPDGESFPGSEIERRDGRRRERVNGRRIA